MKTTIIKRSKNYLRIIAIILLMVLTLYMSSVFLLHPTEHIYFLLPARNSVIIFSILGIMICILVIFLILKNITRKDAILKIDEHGIFNSFFFYQKKFIKWEEIMAYVKLCIIRTTILPGRLHPARPTGT